MRMAKPVEIIAAFGFPTIQSVCGVSTPTIGRWKRQRHIPEEQLVKLALRFPHKLIVDDDGVSWWIDEITFEPPGWVPSRWWEAYMNIRQQEHLPCDERDLQRVIEELDRLRGQGQDLGSVLRYATVNRLAVPVAVTRTE